MKVETMLEIVKKSTTDTAKICKTTFNAPSQARTQANATSNATLNLSIRNRNLEEPNTPEVILHTCIYIAGSQSREVRQEKALLAVRRQLIKASTARETVKVRNLSLYVGTKEIHLENRQSQS